MFTLFGLIPLIAKTLLSNTKIGEKAATSVAWLITIVGVALLIFAGWSLLKGAIIEDYEKTTRAETAESTLAQQEEAQAADDEQEDIDDAFVDDLEQGARDAEKSDPQGAGAAVGPATSAVADRLRDRGKPQPPR